MAMMRNLSVSTTFFLLCLAVLVSLYGHRTGAWRPNPLATTRLHPPHLHLHLHLLNPYLQCSFAQKKRSTNMASVLRLTWSSSTAAWFGGRRDQLCSTAMTMTMTSEGGMSDDDGKKKMSRSMKRWSKIKKALLTYKSIHGNLLVPRKFTVPQNDTSWEQDLWGMKLGTTVDSIRNNNAYSEHKQELEEMGFDFDPQAERYGWDLVKRALQAYTNMNGHLLVPQAFTVPQNDTSWDPDLWGMKLGDIVMSIRNKNTYSENRHDLMKMGFDFDPQAERYGWDLVKRALQAYKNMNGHMLVPRRFIVSEGDASWDPDLWGMKLGNTVSKIRNRNVYSKYRQELMNMGFDFDPQKESYGWDLVKRALLTYKNMNGSLLIPQTFIIPEGDASWNPDLWSMKLGNTVCDIRNRNDYSKNRQELIEMGFDYDPQRYGWDLVKRALEAFTNVNGHMLVPYKFIVPEGDASWEQDLWSMKLGITVGVIRNRNDYSEHKQELEEMGFEYDPQAVSYGWELVKRALQCYTNLNGQMLVPYTYIVPNNASWDPDLWGMKLGSEVSIIRNSNAYSDHRQELEQMGFDYVNQFFRRWLRLKSALLTYKSIYEDLLVPYSFFIPINDPVWDPDLWGMTLGVSVRNIRNRNTYKAHRAELKEMGVYN